MASLGAKAGGGTAWLSRDRSDGRFWRSDDGSRPRIRSGRGRRLWDAPQEIVKSRLVSGAVPGRSDRRMILAGARLVRTGGTHRHAARRGGPWPGGMDGEDIAQIVGVVGHARHLRGIGECRVVVDPGDRRPGEGLAGRERPRLRQGRADHQDEGEEVEQARQDVTQDAPQRRTEGVRGRKRSVCAEKRLWVRYGATHIPEIGASATPEQVPAAFCLASAACRRLAGPAGGVAGITQAPLLPPPAR